MAETITVHIHGTEYKLRGDDAARVRTAASLINEQMQLVSSKASTQPPATIAVLAALNTAELLMNEQEQNAEESAYLARRLDALNLSLREMLDSES